MPIYEYSCVICSNRFDKRRAMSEIDDPAPCPDCGSESRRVFSVFAAFSADGSGQSSAVSGAVPAGGCGAAPAPSGGGPAELASLALLIAPAGLIAFSVRRRK